MSKEDNLNKEKDIGNLYANKQEFILSHRKLFLNILSTIPQFLLMFTLSVHQNLDTGLEEFFREPMLSDFMVL